jgi:hypothetical protein
MSDPEDEQAVRAAIGALLERCNQLLDRLDQAKNLLGELVTEAPPPRRSGGVVVKIDDAYAKALSQATDFLLNEEEEGE